MEFEVVVHCICGCHVAFHVRRGMNEVKVCRGPYGKVCGRRLMVRINEKGSLQVTADGIPVRYRLNGEA